MSGFDKSTNIQFSSYILYVATDFQNLGRLNRRLLMSFLNRLFLVTSMI